MKDNRNKLDKLDAAEAGLSAGAAGAHGKETAGETVPVGRTEEEAKQKLEALKAAKKIRRSHMTTLLLVLIFLLGLAIMAYPSFSDWWNSFHQSRAIASYANMVENTSQKEIDAMLEAARKYNKALLHKENRYRMDEEDLKAYNALLNLSGTGVMGYIQIPSISVNLPIYHSTEENVLQIAIGHIEWSSLPVGGETTHSVLSGHRGLPRAKLFTDLDKLTEGDLFTVTILNETLTYRVDQIRIVEPADISEMNISSGHDYCTLVTCTPYGVNTHRMLVRGTRVENAENTVVLTPEGIRIPNYIAIPAVGVPLLFLFLLGMIIYYRRRKPELTEEELIAQYAEQIERLKAEQNAQQEEMRQAIRQAAQAGMSSNKTPADDAPAEEVPADDAPAEEALTDDAPAEEGAAPSADDASVTDDAATEEEPEGEEIPTDPDAEETAPAADGTAAADDTPGTHDA